MVRYRSRIALAALLLVLTGLLTACQKPLPTITVYGDGRSVILDASAYQFPGGPARIRTIDPKTLSVQAGSTVLIDVPRVVATNAWLVTSYTVDATGKTSVLADASSPVITDRHTTRISTGSVGVGAFLVRVAAFKSSPDVPTGVWVFQVRTTG